MLKIRLLLAVALMLALSAVALRAAPPPQGEAAELDVLLNAIRSNRTALVAANLKLTDEEATKFWPVYERYHKEINAIGDRLAGVIQEYATNFSSLSDDKAMQLVDAYLTVEADRTKVKRTYVDEFAKALSGRKLMRFYQIENKMDAVIRYDVAASIPVVDEEAAAPAK